MCRNTVLMKVRNASYRNLGSVAKHSICWDRYSQHLYIFIPRRCTLMLCQASWLSACNLVFSLEVLGSVTGRGVTRPNCFVNCPKFVVRTWNWQRPVPSSYCSLYNCIHVCMFCTLIFNMVIYIFLLLYLCILIVTYVPF